MGSIVCIGKASAIVSAGWGGQEKLVGRRMTPLFLVDVCMAIGRDTGLAAFCCFFCVTNNSHSDMVHLPMPVNKYKYINRTNAKGGKRRQRAADEDETCGDFSCGGYCWK